MHILGGPVVKMVFLRYKKTVSNGRSIIMINERFCVIVAAV
jgi:hypothetical protein